MGDSWGMVNAGQNRKMRQQNKQLINTAAGQHEMLAQQTAMLAGQHDLLAQQTAMLAEQTQLLRYIAETLHRIAARVDDPQPTLDVQQSPN